MTKKRSTKFSRGFTLIELLIVIGILAILATVVVMIINPAQMFKQSRDANRLTEIQAINSALLLYQGAGGSSIGSHNIVYVSLPSDQPDCSDLGLPAPGAGYTYACATTANYRNTDGTGWVPVNFSSVQGTVGTLFTSLPIDPVNTVANDYYYTYIVGSWTLSTTMESDKYLAANAANDGGIISTRFEVGNELALNENLPGGAGFSATCTGASVSYDGGNTICTYTSSGSFEVVSGSADIEVLVVGGGGGGSTGGGGGGAGGLIYDSSYAVSTGNYTVTIGGGGAAASSGGNSVFGVLTAIGGGGGGEANTTYGDPLGPELGGSGGGPGGSSTPGKETGGPGTDGQGHAGGNITNLGSPYPAAGGGGAGAVGGNGAGSLDGDGGIGISYSISGALVYYAGGGGGGHGLPGGAGGFGGGGAGAATGGTPGTANTGGGGGGDMGSGTAGGSGIVIVRYLTP